jgi:Tfp pilus assembly protein PilF
VSEETEGQDTGAEAVAGGVDPAAAALALNGASREDAGAFLKDQRALIADQRHHLHEQLKQLKLGIFSQRISIALKGLTASVGLMAVIALGAVVWNAAHAEGLVIESFSVPPDLAQRGLTGEVIAGELLDRLTELNQATISSRNGKSYAASWGDEIKVEIPDTGISVGQAYRFLRRWLGHESYISGAVWHNQSGIVITARTEGKSVTVTGPDDDIGSHIRKASEAVFGLAEPYRYGVYLSYQGRSAEADAVFRQQAASGSAVDRVWGLIGLARSRNGNIGSRERERLYREALLLNPDNLTALNNLASVEQTSSRLENANSVIRADIEVLGRGGNSEEGSGGLSLPTMRQVSASVSRELMGSYREVASSIAKIINTGNADVVGGLSTRLVRMNIKAHDLRTARATSRDHDRRLQLADLFAFNGFLLDADLADAEQNWPAVMAASASAEALQRGRANLRDLFFLRIAPMQAYAEARLGRFREAEALIAKTPNDCDECILQRARIADLEGQHARADWWFARAVHDAPSIPLMYAAWGQALLERGRPDAAITQFTVANQKGPHFADPLEGWGEALMAKNHSHLALAKFAEAEKYAPNWGRLHLKWGEALAWAGKADEARKQFALAAGLDLTPSEKSELAKHP